ncbi:alanine racemase [Corynascus novoguineensis]|uniref:Alanine racemase n=1 Tax=Corynascus novoguineensis TaxID=1126955 RepID=A0AAN7D1B4_9PEZI|nr:alanine racemase [Corynascus novoguineensis]
MPTRSPGEILSGQEPHTISDVRRCQLFFLLVQRRSRRALTPLLTTAADAITTPSLRQLAAISRATLNDDVFGEDRATAQLERHMAAVCGRDAAAFVISGTMANQLAVGALLGHQRAGAVGPRGVLADASAHVVNFEAGGLAALSGATVLPVRPTNGLYLTVADVTEHAKIEPENDGGSDNDDDDSDGLPLTDCPTRIVSLENTVHGNVVPIRELRALKEWASSRGVLVHIDGARAWHAVASRKGTSGGTLADMAACADAMTLSFAKGIGAPIGAVVVGSAAVIRRVKRLRQSIGGGVRKMGVLAAAAREALLENFGPESVDVRGVFGHAHDMAAAVSRMWTDRGGRLSRPTETNMVWLDLASAGVTADALNQMGIQSGILLAGPRIVLHYQICPKALESLEQVFEKILVHRQLKADAGLNGFAVRSKACV